jgi:hypothetical protein
MLYKMSFNYSFRDHKEGKKLSELEELKQTRDNMESHIRRLWDDVIVPYLENDGEKQILSGLTSNDYFKFHNYMLLNNEIFSYVVNRIAYLQKEE